MTTKAEAKKAFPTLFGRWAQAAGIPARPTDQPSYSAFKRWARDNGYGGYFSFRSVRGADDDIEDWFDRHFHQSWRN